MFKSVLHAAPFRIVMLFFAMAFVAGGGVRSGEEGTVMTLADLEPDVTEIPAASAPAAGVESSIPPTPAEATPVTVLADPLIYTEDGSLYTGPMPDGTYCVNGVVTAAGVPPPDVVYDMPADIQPYEFEYDADDAQGTVILERPWIYLDHGFIDPDIERYWGDHIRLPGDSRWDLYRYLPERRPLHRPRRPDRFRDRDRDRPPGISRTRPEGLPRVRPEGARPPRPHEIGRPTGPRGGSDRSSRPPRPDRPPRPRR